MSFIYIIFNDNVEFYWSRSRILEKLNSLPSGTLPSGVQPALGPDATALGQIFWYTLEGRNPKTGKPTGGWDPEELRTIQDFYAKYSLSSAEGVSEVASIGGYVKEYQVEINPDAMRAYKVSVMAGASSGMSDVLRIQIEMAETDNNIESLLSEIKAETAKFNSLLNRAPESAVQIPDSITQVLFQLDELSVLSKIESQNPTLKMILEEGLSYEAKLKTDKKMGYPMLGIGMEYMLNKKTNEEMLSMGDMNGKDMIMPMVTVSIPLYRNKYKAMMAIITNAAINFALIRQSRCMGCDKMRHKVPLFCSEFIASKPNAIPNNGPKKLMNMLNDL